MKKERNYSLSHEILHKYLDASLINASDLLTEATTLLSQERYARAYFLACAAMEETGKGYLAFSAMGRNLNNPGVQTTVKMSFEDHRSKLVSAMICLLKKKEITKEKIEEFIDIGVHLKIGREKSMYVDINEKHEITTPSEVVRPRAALDAVRLAKDCLEATGEYILNNQPDQFTALQDKFLCMNKKKMFDMVNTRNFWDFCLDQLQKNRSGDITEIFVKYHDEYYCKKKPFEKTANKSTHSNA
jgi:AbiV family abortive infection protein